MKMRHILGCISSALLAAGFTVSALAQTVTTDPVGFYQVNVNANSDGRIGLGLHRAPVLTTTVASVSENTINLNATLTADQFVYSDGVQNDHFYLLVKGGATEGKWYEITDNDAASVTVDQGASPETVEIQGLLADTQVTVIPFWTLNTLFPDGQGIDASADPFNPTTLIFLNNLQASGTNIWPDRSYLYYNGTEGPIGWYKNGDIDAGVQNNLPLTPDTFVVIRNVSNAKTITVSGSVPMTDASTEVIRGVQRQDNLLSNPFPVPITLAESKLLESGAVTASSDPFNPVDLVMMYNPATSARNVPPSKSYFFYDGSQGGDAGWYESGNLDAGLQDGVKLIQPGDAIVVRKAAGTPEVANWTATRPY